MGRSVSLRTAPLAAGQPGRSSIGLKNTIVADQEALRLGNACVRSFEHVVVNFEPDDVAIPPCVLGSDLIDYVTTFAELHGESDAIQWTRSAEVIDPTQSYTTSLEATPDRSAISWIPPAGSGLATVIFLTQAAETTVLIRYAHGGPSTRCP
jgi:hypothetical protein